jgi:hypothetical protein
VVREYSFDVAAGGSLSGELSASVEDIYASATVGGSVSLKATAALQGTISGGFEGEAKVEGTTQGIC